VEQLGWPRAEISYRTGTRHPESARIHLQDRVGTPLALELDTVTSVPLHVGAGYGGDPDWSHGRWMGRGWSQASVYDLTDPAVAGRIPFGVIDHLARAGFDGEEGWGLFEHASMGRHDPTGFADWSSVAPEAGGAAAPSRTEAGPPGPAAPEAGLGRGQGAPPLRPQTDSAPSNPPAYPTTG
jgi:hypothetical protein